ncbi:MAG: HAD family phosphatase [Ruminococcaceae bacterium]|nr:HAD family phosphatase [Oscillospiraceae bacterium]
MIRLIAFDLDGTLTQHKTPLTPENRAALTALSEKYQLVMAGAGLCMRIFEQMEHFPIDIIGSYGMQAGKYNRETGMLDICLDEKVSVDRDSVEARVSALRQKYGFTEFAGDNVQYHSSGCVTIPLLGTAAKQEDKLAFDPDRAKRRKIYGEVCELFHDYNVFVGGSSSFDMAPRPYNKYYALDLYCKERGITHDEVIFVGDDYGMGGNDESVYKSDFGFITIDDYRTFPERIRHLLV